MQHLLGTVREHTACPCVKPACSATITWPSSRHVLLPWSALQAEQLAEDMRARRQSSFAAVVAKAKMTPEQIEQLASPTAAARILDMLLTLTTHEERAACLTDCFTPPADLAERSSSGSSSEGAAGQEYDELWCTPSQLLQEVESRCSAVAAGAAAAAGAVAQLPGAAAHLAGGQYSEALLQLRDAIRGQWLDSMAAGK